MPVETMLGYSIFTNASEHIHIDIYTLELHVHFYM